MGSSFFETTNGGALTEAGKAVVGLDLNGDGIDDVVYAAGDVTVVYGDAGGFEPVVDLDTLDPTAGFTLTGPTLGDEFGYVLAKATDLQNTGGDALLIGARATGIVSVVFTDQTTIGFTVTGLPIWANGMSLAGLGDINGDGIGDFAIGAPDANTDDGAVYVIYGSTKLGDTIDTIDVSALDGTNGFIIDGFGDGDLAGTAIAGGFDFNSDGINDLLIGAPGHDNDIGGPDAGAVYVVYGSAASVTTETDGTVALASLTHLEFTGIDDGDALGATVSAGGDINGDNIDDIIIGAPLAGIDRSDATYVVFGGTNPTTNLASLDGSNGFAINGVSVASVEMLGDVSGDGIDDLGIVSTTGDVFIVFGLNTTGPTGDFAAIIDVTALDGTDGIALTGLFAGTPASVSLAALGDVNSDPSGPIGDIGIIATYDDGTPTASFTVLGGTANFAALDAADNPQQETDGKIDFAAITTPVDFVETSPTIELTGVKAATINEDAEKVSGAIGIRDNSNNTSPTFIGSSSVYGLYGLFTITEGGDEWVYDVTSDLKYLDQDQEIVDSGTFVASNGTRREITITIVGLDNAATLKLIYDSGEQPTEDNGQFSGVIEITDLDGGAVPTLVAGTVNGTHGNIEVAADGSFTYFLTDAALQESLSSGQSVDDVIALVVNDGSTGQTATYNITVTIAGAEEGVTLTFSDDPNAPDTIFTSFGNDIIEARAGNDFINAGGGNDTVDAGTGNDTIVDPLGDDDVTGGEGDDDILLLSGNNTVDAGIGNDKIVTGFGYDTIDAGDGNDVIAADHGSIFMFGNNRITGGAGDDYMMGGMGIDTFVFNTDDGNDTIGAFDPDKVVPINDGYTVNSTGRSFQVGVDKIELSGFGLSQGNVMDFVTYDPDSRNSVFEAGNTRITLINVELTETDFIFV